MAYYYRITSWRFVQYKGSGGGEGMWGMGGGFDKHFKIPEELI